MRFYLPWLIKRKAAQLKALLFQPFLRFYSWYEATTALLSNVLVSTLLEILRQAEEALIHFCSPPVSTLLEILQVDQPVPGQPALHDVSTLLEILRGSGGVGKVGGREAVSTLLEILLHSEYVQPSPQDVMFQPFLRFYQLQIEKYGKGMNSKFQPFLRFYDTA